MVDHATLAVVFVQGCFAVLVAENLAEKTLPEPVVVRRSRRRLNLSLTLACSLQIVTKSDADLPHPIGAQCAYQTPRQQLTIR